MRLRTWSVPAGCKLSLLSLSRPALVPRWLCRAQSDALHQFARFDVSSTHYRSKQLLSRRKSDASAGRDPQKQKLRALAGEGQLFDHTGQVTLNPIYLRDACQCSRCIDYSTKQRDFLFADIPTDIRAVSKGLSSIGDWSVVWENDIPSYLNHVSQYSEERVRLLAANGVESSESVYSAVPRSLWKKEDLTQRMKSTSFDDFTTSSSGLATVVRDLRRDGLKFITDVPSRPEAVAEIAQRIGPLRNTFYGPTWDVRSVVDSKNIAYTNKYLGFHMDLLYMTMPPGYQLLHCIQNSCSGGESRFVDTYKALDVSSVSHPEMVGPLTQSSVIFHYQNNGYHYRNRTKLVKLAKGMYLDRRDLTGAQNHILLSSVRHIYWSPPFMANIDGNTMKTKRFIESSKLFADALERDDLVFETKMDEGTCVIFDNTRVAHARNAFDTSSGERWLRGAYIDKDDFESKLSTLAKDISALDQTTPM